MISIFAVKKQETLVKMNESNNYISTMGITFGLQ